MKWARLEEQVEMETLPDEGLIIENKEAYGIDGLEKKFVELISELETEKPAPRKRRVK